MNIEESDGYKKLLTAVENDEQRSPKFHDYRAKLQWILERAYHYAEKLGLDACDILNAWEKSRSYWYMNYYQDCNQPKIEDGKVKVFKTIDEARESIGKEGFRCPYCNGVSKDAVVCDSGLQMDKKPCDWKAYGLFGTLGKGANVYVCEELRLYKMFMPIAWEPK